MFGAVTRLGWLPERRRHALACSMSPPEMTTGETHSRAKEPMNRAKNPLRKRAAPFSGEGSFLDTFTHEVGHAFGFWHVTDFKAAMWNGSGFAIEFNAQEQYHARLAYEVGRGQPYAGWPFQFGPAEGSQDWPTGSIPVIVIDD